MRFLFFPTVIVLLATAGCETKTDDMARLKRIDNKLVNGQYETVVSESQKYVSDYPRSARGWTVLGWSHEKTDDPDKAIECFNRAIKLDPNGDNAYVGKGVALRAKGDLKGARQSYLKAISIESNNPEAYTSLLVIELLEHNDAKAVEYGERAWALRKDLASIPANLAIAYHYLGNDEKGQSLRQTSRTTELSLDGQPARHRRWQFKHPLMQTNLRSL